MEKVTVEMTTAEAQAYEQFCEKQKRDAAAAKAKEDREAYKQLVDEMIEESIPELLNVSLDIATVKSTVLSNFKAVLDMKAELFDKPLDKQQSNTFTNSAGDKRIILGVYVTDGYRDTVNEGIEIVKECLEGLGQDDKSTALVKMVFKLLSRDAKGTLKASRVVQLRKTAEEMGDERMLEGVRIIEEAYQPTISKQYIRAEIRGAMNEWVTIPLGMTEA